MHRRQQSVVPPWFAILLIVATCVGSWTAALASPVCAGPDGDGVGDACDNCPAVFNAAIPVQAKLNGPLVAGGNVDLAFRLTPDDATLVYRADQDTLGALELFSVPVAGGTPTLLSGPLPAGEEVLVEGFSFSPDGARVVYATSVFLQPKDLYSVPAAGGAPVLLQAGLATGGAPFLISPDSASVISRAGSVGAEELFRAPIAGGTSVKLNGPLVAGGDASFFQVNPDSSSVLYLADQDTDAVVELYVVPAGGGAPVNLNAPLPAGGNVFWAFFTGDGLMVGWG